MGVRFNAQNNQSINDNEQSASYQVKGTPRPTPRGAARACGAAAVFPTEL